jgi:hypothetical protein
LVGAQFGSQHAGDVAGFVAARLVGEDVGDAVLSAGARGGAPGKADFREVGRNLHQRVAVLCAVGNHQVVATAGVLTDGGCGVGHVEHILAVGDLQLVLAHLRLQFLQADVHRLAPGDVVDRARHQQRHAHDLTSIRRRCIGGRCVGGWLLAASGRRHWRSTRRQHQTSDQNQQQSPRKFAHRLFPPNKNGLN